MSRANVARFELRTVHKPHVQGGLSSTVVIDGTHYVNVGFNLKLVRHAGNILPRGISDFDPAYMSLRFDLKTGIYTLYVQYLDGPRSTGAHFLIRIHERPEWLKWAKAIKPKTKEQS